jgi:site-specific DNA recombinase
MTKARNGHVTGGKVFGYDNVRVGGHVERRINPTEAAVIQDIFQRYANGEGFKGIAHALNGLGLPSPRPQRGRPSGWDPGTVRAALRRSLYRGIVVYNKTSKRSEDGKRFPGRQPKKSKDQWLTVESRSCSRERDRHPAGRRTS